MQIVNDFKFGQFRCVIIRCPYLGKYYNKKHSYIVYTMLGPNFWEKELYSFGYRIKTYKHALTMFIMFVPILRQQQIFLIFVFFGTLALL